MWISHKHKANHKPARRWVSHLQIVSFTLADCWFDSFSLCCAKCFCLCEHKPAIFVPAQNSSDLVHVHSDFWWGFGDFRSIWSDSNITLLSTFHWIFFIPQTRGRLWRPFSGRFLFVSCSDNAFKAAQMIWMMELLSLCFVQSHFKDIHGSDF